MRISTPLLLATLAQAATATAGAEEQPQAGLWKAHDVDFSYMGFTSQYSCDSLADKLKLLLTLAGARKDAKATPGFCERPSGPSRISSARLSFRTLVAEAADAPPAAPTETPPGRTIGRPAPALKAVTAPQPGVGAWRTVEWRAGRPRSLDRGDCELVEQFARELLPLFTTRALVNHISCAPNDLLGSVISLKFEVLGPLPQAEQPGVPPTAPPPAQ